MRRVGSERTSGKFTGINYIVSEIPLTDLPDTAETDQSEPDTDKPDTVEPDTAETTQVSNDIKQELKDSKKGNNQTGSTKNQKKEKPKTEHCEHFEKFYAAYPKKEARVKAEEAWRKINPDLYPVIIADVINRAENHVGWNGDKQYICAPSVYLNQKRWTDEIRTDSRIAQRDKINQFLQRPQYEYTPSASRFDTMKTIDGEVIDNEPGRF